MVAQLWLGVDICMIFTSDAYLHAPSDSVLPHTLLPQGAL